MADRRASGELPEKFQHPRTERQEAEYFITRFSKGECLGRIRGILTESQVRAFIGVMNELDVQDKELYRACKDRLEELKKYQSA